MNKQDMIQKYVKKAVTAKERAAIHRRRYHIAKEKGYAKEAEWDALEKEANIIEERVCREVIEDLEQLQN